MHTESFQARRGRRPRPPFRHRNRHPGLAERETSLPTPVPKGEIPAAFAETVFGQIHPLLQHAVAEADYQTPTPIQEKAIPQLLEGRDLLGCAQTGTGKTAAFLLPILHRLTANPKEQVPTKPRALILAPTRELAAQIATNTTAYSKYLGLPFAVVFGGVSQYPQVKALNHGAVLVVATPGRLLDLMEQGHVSLDHVEEFVLDEADRMLDMGFMPDIKRILGKLPEQRHTMFFSATLSPEVLRLAMTMVKDPVHVTISPDQPTVDKINQKIMFVEKSAKDGLLTQLLTDHPEYAKVLVFARTRHGADRIERKLEQADIRAAAIHSDKTQRARMNALSAFRNGRVRVLVATDIASRGIDVDNITHVINFDLPEETESYIHRIGRTARAGADGAAISFVSADQRGLLRAIERMIRKEIPIDREHAFHSEKAEKAAGKSGNGALPRPPWMNRDEHGRERRSSDGDRRNRRPPSHAGHRQPDYKQPVSDELGIPPWEIPETDGERPPRHERPPRREKPPRREEQPRPQAEAKDRPPRRDQPAGGQEKHWFDKPYSKFKHRHQDQEAETDGEKRPHRDREQPPRFDEPEHGRGAPTFQHRPGDAHSKPRSGKAGFSHGKPHSGGFKHGFKGSGKPKRQGSRPPWAKGR